jgi:hypothetical protein
MDVDSAKQAETCADFGEAAYGLFSFKFEGGRRRCHRALPMTIEESGRRLKFHPDNLYPGEFYVFYINGADKHELDDEDLCQKTLCSRKERKPLKTNLFRQIPEGELALGGGDDMEIPFTLSGPSQGVLVAAQTFGDDNQMGLQLDTAREGGFTGVLSHLDPIDTSLSLKGSLLSRVRGQPQKGYVELEVLPSVLVSEGHVIQGYAFLSTVPSFNMKVETGPLIARIVGRPKLRLFKSESGLRVEGTMSLILDAPALYLKTGAVPLKSDLHGKRIESEVVGDVWFSGLGEMTARLRNKSSIHIESKAELGEELASIFLKIPSESMEINVITRR